MKGQQHTPTNHRDYVSTYPWYGPRLLGLLEYAVVCGIALLLDWWLHQSDLITTVEGTARFLGVEIQFAALEHAAVLIIFVVLGVASVRCFRDRIR